MITAGGRPFLAASRGSGVEMNSEFGVSPFFLQFVAFQTVVIRSILGAVCCGWGHYTANPTRKGLLLNGPQSLTKNDDTNLRISTFETKGSERQIWANADLVDCGGCNDRSLG